MNTTDCEGGMRLEEALTSAIELARNKPDYVDGYAVNLLIAERWGMSLSDDERQYLDQIPEWRTKNVEAYLARHD